MAAEQFGVPWFIEWLWAPLYGALVVGWRMVSKLRDRVTVLETIEAERKARHEELMDALTAHNDQVTQRLDRFADELVKVADRSSKNAGILDALAQQRTT